ncbi:phage baseplate assembly protein V [Paraburkholderia sp. IW21]|uniref:phage baseplate assembly protein V n=1 Tax=Paraburkholderia sp. IW21 TaxID=3242488 RepID=UPI003521C27C
MRPVPLIVLQTGEPALPLTVLKPVWAETLHTVNGIPTAKIVLSVAGDPLGTLPSCDEDIALCKPGRAVTVLLMENGVESCIFRGVIVQQTLKMRRSRVELTLLLRHNLQKLLSTHRSQVFEQKNDAAIVSSLLLAQGIPLLGAAGMGILHEQIVQFRCADWHFIRCRLVANGVWLLPTPDGVSIMPPTLSAVPEHTLRQRASLSNEDVLIEESDWSFSELRQPAELTVASWNDEAQTNDMALAAVTPLGTQAFDSATGERLGATPWEFNYSTPLGLEETATLAKSLLMNLQSASARGEFVVEGSTHFQLGQTLAVEDFGLSFNGQGIITGVAQRIHKEEGWRTTLSLGTDDIVADTKTIPRVHGLHIGVVASFVKDVSGMNRLRVSVPVLGDVNNVLWARFASPYASNMSGFCFYPEIGDEVVVGFFDEDPCYPVILGSMHNPINPAPIEPSLENNNKALVINQDDKQLQLSFDTLSISAQLTAAENQLTLQEGVKLEGSDTLVVKAASISIEGEETTMSGKSVVNITGARIDLSH